MKNGTVSFTCEYQMKLCLVTHHVRTDEEGWHPIYDCQLDTPCHLDITEKIAESCDNSIYPKRAACTRSDAADANVLPAHCARSSS